MDDTRNWIAGRLLGASNFGLAILQMEPEGEEAESEEMREEEEKADERRDFELSPWRNPNAIPPVEIEPFTRTQPWPWTRNMPVWFLI